MNGSYQGIAEYYDDIFRFDESQKRFLERWAVPNDVRHLRILDIGCGTGELALQMSMTGTEFTGIDSDRKMIHIAEKKRKMAELKNVRFRSADMTRLKALFPVKKFNSILCMGNTMVHLPDFEAIGKFFLSVHGRLVPDGLFIFQIMNYEKILRTKPAGLPTIENDRIRFERTYIYDPVPGKIRFDMDLTIQTDGRKITSSTILVPATLHDLEPLWLKAGFRSEQIIGDFSGKPYDPQSGLVIGVLRSSNMQISKDVGAIHESPATEV
jgi:glycine/sarcosine N-methyltransferase